MTALQALRTINILKSNAFEPSVFQQPGEGCVVGFWTLSNLILRSWAFLASSYFHPESFIISHSSSHNIPTRLVELKVERANDLRECKHIS